MGAPRGLLRPFDSRPILRGSSAPERPSNNNRRMGLSGPLELGAGVVTRGTPS